MSNSPSADDIDWICQAPYGDVRFIITRGVNGRVGFTYVGAQWHNGDDESLLVGKRVRVAVHNLFNWLLEKRA